MILDLAEFDGTYFKPSLIQYVSGRFGALVVWSREKWRGDRLTRPQDDRLKNANPLGNLAEIQEASFHKGGTEFLR